MLIIVCRSQDQQKLVWQFPQAVAEPQSMQAKFELNEGPSHPSPTLVQLVPSYCIVTQLCRYSMLHILS